MVAWPARSKATRMEKAVYRAPRLHLLLGAGKIGQKRVRGGGCPED